MIKNLYAAGAFMGYTADCGCLINGYDNKGNYVGYFLPDSNCVVNAHGEIVGDSVGILEGLCVQSSIEHRGY